MSEVIKRFIAGAVCPACGRMDKIRVYQLNRLQYRECVYCDYLDTIETSAPNELPTRITPEHKIQDDFQVVKLFKQNDGD